jgi:hypothetical protein
MAVNDQTRAAGHWQLLVAGIGPELNGTVRQLKHKLPIITLLVGLQDVQLPTPLVFAIQL